ncbi:MAG TPA: CocE/NonD family hydrolase [Anaerolineales bacterium]
MNQSDIEMGNEVDFGKLVAREPQYKAVDTDSIYLTMQDGVKIALDVMMPADLPAGVKLPTIMVIARYWRSFELRTPSAPGKAPMGPRDPIADYLISYGYAVVIIDVRGSGASFGKSDYPWSSAEVEDYGEVVSWVINQPWSDGKVGAIGISYEGTSANLLPVAHPDVVKAVIPQETEWDVFTDIIFPGGILNAWFMQTWQRTNDALDRNQVPGEWGLGARLFVRGVRPVDVDRDRKQLQQAVAAHMDNVNVYEATKDIIYRDDSYGSLDIALDDFSLFRHQEQIERSGAAIFGWGSWMDSNTADAVLQPFVRLESYRRAVIGAWAHRFQHHASPYGNPKAEVIPSLKDGWGEALAFFDEFLKEDSAELHPDKLLYYFTLGEEKWKSTQVWPPAGMSLERWYLAPDGLLSRESPTQESGADTYTVDFEATSGKTNRWHTPDGMTQVIYKDRSRADRRLLTYTSPPLSEDVEFTGHPVISLYLTSSESDGAFYVYLEDVDESGKVIYVTEGQLRAIHRKVSNERPPYQMLVPYHSFKRQDSAPLIPSEVAELTFGLLPTSVLFRKGHRIRIAIAGHDKDTFARIPEVGTPVISVQRNRIHASYIDLPRIDRG